jgi:hypothetical protein
LTYAERCEKVVRRFFLVHGELPAQESLRKAMQQRNLRVEIPQRGEIVELS